LDDRALVQLRSHVVRGRTDDLDAAFVRLVIRSRAAEARQEGMVDVDGAALELAAQRIGEHLHVTGEDHQLRALVLDETPELRFLLRPGVGGDRQVNEGDPVRRDELPGMAVIAGDRYALHGQRADPVAITYAAGVVSELRSID